MLKIFKKKNKEIYAYISGELIPLEEVKDEVFSTKTMGDGVAIIAKDNVLCAPCEGKVSLIAPSKHAIAIETKDGMQILLHIGLDSANYSDSLFDVEVKLDDYVSTGDVLISIDQNYMNTLDELVIPMIVLENNEGFQLRMEKHHEVISGKHAIIIYE